MTDPALLAVLLDGMQQREIGAVAMWPAVVESAARGRMIFAVLHALQGWRAFRESSGCSEQMPHVTWG